MITQPDIPPFVKRTETWRRAGEADGAMVECRLCGWDCGADRTKGAAGRCHSSHHPNVFQQRMEWAGEEPLIPTRLVNFSGCNFRCSFCLTGRDSQDARRGQPFDAMAVAESLHKDRDCYRSVTIEGGEASIFLPDALRVASMVPRDVTVVWKTNGWASDSALQTLKGHIDVFLVDYKFGNDECAQRLAGIPDYLEHLRRNVRWGNENSDMIIRHLLMPGHIDCCLGQMLEWLKAELPHAKLSIVTGFVPLWNSRRNAELLTPLSPDEMELAQRLVTDSGLQVIPWTVATPATEAAETDPPDDHIYIDKGGRICVPFMTAALRQCLQKIENEIPTAVNL